MNITYQATKISVFVSTLFLATPALADWPIALTDSFTMHQSEPGTTLNVLGNDFGDELSITAVNAWTSKGGRATAAGGKSIGYTPPQNFTGDDTFWYVITDNKGRTNAAKATVTIKPSSSPFPVAQPDVVKVQKDKNIRIDVMKNDITLLSPVITEFNAWSQQGGKITEVGGKEVFGYPLKSGSQLQYAPPAGFVGTDTFWYTIKNSIYSDGYKYATKVTVQVTEENSAGTYPVAKPDLITVNARCFEGVSIVGVVAFSAYCQSQFLEVISNDTGKNLKLSLNSPWSLNGAKVTVSDVYKDNPKLSYTAKPSGGNGEDKIWYTIEDEVGRKTWGAVTLNVITTY